MDIYTVRTHTYRHKTKKPSSAPIFLCDTFIAHTPALGLGHPLTNPMYAGVYACVCASPSSCCEFMSCARCVFANALKIHTALDARRPLLTLDVDVRWLCVCVCAEAAVANRRYYTLHTRARSVEGSASDCSAYEMVLFIYTRADPIRVVATSTTLRLRTT